MQRRAPLEEFAHADWHELMKTNLDSVFFVGQAVARHMIPRGSGKIINVCSVQSELGRPNIAPYTASKGAVKMLTKGMAIDWGPHGIQVNGLGPGYFKTELNEALVKQRRVQRLAHRPYAVAPLGRCRGPGRARPCSWPAMHRTSSTATSCMSTAASPPLFEQQMTQHGRSRHSCPRRPAGRRRAHARGAAAPTARARALRRHLRLRPALLPARRLRHGTHAAADGAGP